MKKLYIIGLGVGKNELLTFRAKQIIDSSDRILNSRDIKIKELFERLKTTESETTVVLVSGDCGFYSVSKSIISDFSEIYNIEIINGISSIQYFSSKLLVSYDDAKIISLHGRDNLIVPFVAYNKKLFALTGGAIKAHDVCKILCRLGLSSIKIWVGEKLSFPDERIMSGTALSLSNEVFGNLSVMYIENDFASNPHISIKDEEFIRGNSPMTKEEVRYLSLQKLAIEKTDIVYDIGAGTGSVAVEMARKAFEGVVYAIEKKEEACSLIEKNRSKHGAYNLEIINATAPEGFNELPVPNKAFIGGSSGNIDKILNYLVASNPNIKIVANVIALQSLNEVLECFVKYGLINVETICVNISRSKKLGKYDMMIAQNPIYIITAYAENNL